jgi:WD repeat-containing protein 48
MSHGRSSKKRKIAYYLRANDEKHRFGINKLASFGNHLFTAGRDGCVRQWDCSAAAETEPGWLQTYESHTDWVNDMVVSADGRTLMSCSNDTTIKIWSTDLNQGSRPDPRLVLFYHTDYVKRLALASHRNILASAGFDRQIFLWDLEGSSTPVAHAEADRAWSEPIVARGHRESVYSLAINPSATLLASGSTENVIRLWDPRTNPTSKLGKLCGHTDNIRCLRISEDGQLLLSGSSDGTVRYWDVGERRCIQEYRLTDRNNPTDNNSTGDSGASSAPPAAAQRGGASSRRAAPSVWAIDVNRYYNTTTTVAL